MQRVAEVSKDHALRAQSEAIAFVVMACVLIVAPMFAYPVFLMKALCFALFACAFNLLIGYVGLLSFGHALFCERAFASSDTTRASTLSSSIGGPRADTTAFPNSRPSW